MRPISLALALALLLPAPARPGPRDGDPERLIQGAPMKADVTWLADPARTGRGVGTPGNAAAARFIADRMAALGLVPAGSDGWRQPFDAPVRAVLRGENALALAGAPLALQRDWQPFTFTDPGRASGEVVFAGYGITAPELGYDDYAGLDVKGKIVLVAAHFPREADPASPFRAPQAYRYGEWRYKTINAREHGALALLAVRDGWNHAGPDQLPPWRGAVSSRAGLLAARVTAAALARAGVDAAGLAAPGQADGRPHSHPLDLRAALAADVEQERAPTANVIGLLPGSDPARAGECVVVGAHYDHLGYGGDESLSPEETGKVHPGADDNASGVAALLAVARAMKEAGPAPRTVVFAAFSGEELGLLGSALYVRQPPAACPIPRTQLMLNLDMVGRPRERRVFVDGADTARGLRAEVAAVAARPPALPLRLAFGGDGYGPSDQTSFYAKGVPVLFLFTGAHPDYHRPTDTPDKIDAAGLQEVGRLAYRLARAAAEQPARLEVVRVAAPHPRERQGERERGYGAYLGTIPDFEERHEPGIKVSGVRPGSPAEKAGIAGGDVVLEVAGTRIGSLEDLTYVLRAHRPGDAVEVVYARGADRRSARVTLGERK